LQKLLFESNSTAGITLHQYQDMVDAGLTRSAGCDGNSKTNGAAPNRSGASVLLQVLAPVVALCWLLMGV
jgi:hypothetical protein